MAKRKQTIAIRGAGVVGLWQALTLARAGHEITIHERSTVPFAEACSRYAGAMLAPRCEEESADPVVRELGLRSIALWLETYPTVATARSSAPPRRPLTLDASPA
jgi:glycine oxidase